MSPPTSEDVDDKELQGDKNANVDINADKGEGELDFRGSDSNDSNYEDEVEDVVDDATLSDYQSNNNEENFIKNSKDERLIAQLVNNMKGQEYVPEVSEKIVFRVEQCFNDYKHFRRVLKTTLFKINLGKSVCIITV